MRQILRPFENGWPGQREPHPQRSRFETSWGDIQWLLEREIEHLVRGPHEYVLQIDVTERDVRNDGRLRATARPGYHGVIVSFESKHGPLTYRCDTYDQCGWHRSRSGGAPWQENVYAIAKTLENLRAVERYGAVKSGEQYTGFRALGSGMPMPAAEAPISADEAAQLLIDHGEWGAVPGDPEVLIADKKIAAQYFRQASKKAHPDHGGDEDLFKRLVEAERVLELA